MINRGVIGALSVLLISGCSESAKPYKTASVSGVITLDGQPLAAAHVTFLPVHNSGGGSQSGPEASADTDAGGRYSLKTAFGDTGASVGKNRVMVTTRKTELDPSNPDRSRKSRKSACRAGILRMKRPCLLMFPRKESRARIFI